MLIITICIVSQLARLYDIGRRLSQSDKESLELVAYNLKRLKALPLAAEVFKKLGNEAEVVQLHVEARDWTEAFILAADIPELLPQVHYQHGQWLAENDKFIEAHEGECLCRSIRCTTTNPFHLQPI